MYSLLCLYEIQMTPHLLASIYGFGIDQGTRRPNVFFLTGLELAMWMTVASLSGWWLWRCGAVKKIGPLPFGTILMAFVLVTTILCKSTRALALLIMGVAVLWLSVRLRTRWVLTGFLLVGAVYYALRIPNLWSGIHAVNQAYRWAGPGTRAVIVLSLHVRGLPGRQGHAGARSSGGAGMGVTRSLAREG